MKNLHLTCGQTGFKLLALLAIFVWSSCRDAESKGINAEESIGEREAAYFEDYEEVVNKWGYINKKGKLVIEAKYDDVRDFDGGVAAANYRGKWGLIDQQGQVIIPFEYLNMGQPSEGKLLVEEFEGDKYYLDIKNGTKWPCPYDFCGDFRSGKAIVRSSTGCFFLNTSGQTVGGRYSDALDFEGNHAVFFVGESAGIVDSDMNVVLEARYEDIRISDQVARCRLAGSYVYYDLKKGAFIEGDFEYAGLFEGGKAPVRKGHKYGLIDRTGRFLFTHANKIQALGENRYAVMDDSGFLLYDEKGQVLSPQSFGRILRFSCGTAAFESNNRWGYIDLNGRIIIDAELPLTWDCSDSMIRFITRGGFGYFDEKGQVVIPPKFIEARDFKEGLARVQMYN